MLEIGSLVDGKYRILRKVGQGGMSVVYMALNERANKTWAIKEVRKDGTQNFEVVRQGLIVETDMLKRLDHPHLPSIIDVIDGDGSFLIVMDYIEGKTLSDILKEYGAQPQESVIDWAKQLCNVLGYLHSRKPPIIYRDMKPSNVMLKSDGNIVLFDFGTAREYKVSSIEDTTCLGTRGYAAPEQYGGHGQTDGRTDIYCLGATMYHLLTGHNPSEPPYEMYPIRQWNPNLSVGLEAIILKCTQKNPIDRYQSCAELMYDLENPWVPDIEYRKKQMAKFRGFIIPAALSVFLGVGAAVFYSMEVRTKASNYDAYLTAAKNSTVKEDEITNYRKAINLDPARSEGYLELLQEGFLDDNVLTSEESEELRSVLIDYGNGQDTNEMVFKDNEEGYDRFAYEAGIAYYYKFEEKSNKKNAKSYFEKSVASKYLSPKQIERAKRLYAVSDYYSRIGIVDETGDAPVTFRDYWNDMVSLSAGNLVEADNERTALIMYQELATQIVSRVVDFRNDGVTREEMEAQLTNVTQHLQTDFNEVSAGNREAIQQEIQKLQETIVQARRMIQSAFGKSQEV
ncbi:MAG: serine/threonine protein kinase [Clostridiales bacterium]|nr:serine/threonine protein kinase [Clostridiales bacterium]